MKDRGRKGPRVSKLRRAKDASCSWSEAAGRGGCVWRKGRGGKRGEDREAVRDPVAESLEGRSKKSCSSGTHCRNFTPGATSICDFRKTILRATQRLDCGQVQTVFRVKEHEG